MTTPFVAQLRAREDAIELAPAGGTSMTIRVEMPEVWDTVKLVVAPTHSAAEVKQAALGALYPVAEPASEFVLKLRGFEVLDENMALSELGAKDGSIFLLTHRRRRAVR